MEDYITIRTLKKRNPELGTRKISELMGISRNTVKKALKSETSPEYQRPKKINSTIVPFVEYIYEQKIIKGLIGSRVLNDMKSKGYTGSESAFYRHLSKLREPVKRTFKPYETTPGEQSQYDWSPYTVTIGGELTKVYVFCYILSYSRYRIYEVSLSETAGSVYEALEEGFQQTGGTTQRTQTDNATCFITSCKRDNIEWNKRYLNLCAHYNFKPTRSLPKHPWSKGKVENPFYFLENHFILDNKFEDFNDFIKKLKIFQNEVNNRVHQTTQKKPAELFEEEKPYLGSLPNTRYVDIKEEVRKVTADCLFSFGGNRYSVPHQFACREVWLKVSKGSVLEIYSSKNVIIASHNISTKKHTVIIDNSHYLNHKIERGNWNRLSETFLNLFPSFDWFLDSIKIQRRINPSYHLTQILQIAQFYSSQDLIDSFFSCKKYNVYSFQFIKGFLENNKYISNAIPKAQRILNLLHNSIDIKRSLHEYSLSANPSSSKSAKEDTL